MKKPMFIRCAMVGAALLVSLATPAIAEVSVTGAWVRGTVPGQRGTGAFMQLTSPVATTLIGVSSPVAKIAEVHEMSMTSGMMQMRAIGKLPLPAGKSVELQPGGFHVMLMELAQPLKDGDTVPVTLTFMDSAGHKSEVTVQAPVKGLAMVAPKR